MLRPLTTTSVSKLHFQISSLWVPFQLSCLSHWKHLWMLLKPVSQPESTPVRTEVNSGCDAGNFSKRCLLFSISIELLPAVYTVYILYTVVFTPCLSCSLLLAVGLLVLSVQAFFTQGFMALCVNSVSLGASWALFSCHFSPFSFSEH